MTTTVAPPDALVTTSSVPACAAIGPGPFFSDDMQAVALAKQVCAQCPLRAGCLAGAIQRREPHGVWGGELFCEGVVIERKRPRGRPRKHPLPDGPGAVPGEVRRAA